MRSSEEKAAVVFLASAAAEIGVVGAGGGRSWPEADKEKK
jgi:hypothetical protein